MNQSTEKTVLKEWQLLLLLAGIQFTHILDFVIIMPLGPRFMEVFSINPQQFGFIVSSYTFSAGIAGILGTGFVDRFDRKAILNTSYLGFVLGTYFSAMSPDYNTLLIARIVSGAFGGIIGAMVFSIIGDVIPYERRGKASGIIMSAFSFASVAGVPLGLFLASQYNSWSAPFWGLSIFSTFILILSHFIMPSIRTHLEKNEYHSAFKVYKIILKDKNHLKAFFLITSMMFGGFSVIPFISPYMVSNVGVSEKDLSYLYFFGGGATVFTARIIGILADKYGKFKVFATVAILSTIPIYLITNLPRVPLYLALIVSTLFFILVSGRFIPALAIITSSVLPRNRGGFMSLTSSFQQIASGLASSISGIILTKNTDGSMSNYEYVGYMAIFATIVSIYTGSKIQVAKDHNHPT
jgi:predicted MFS family arabinose efflux permease